MVSPFDRMLIDNYYKFLLVLGGLALLFSLFLPSKILNSLLVFKLAGVTVIYGVLLWIVDMGFKTYLQAKANEYEVVKYEAAKPKNISDYINPSGEDPIADFFNKNKHTTFVKILFAIHFALFVGYVSVIGLILLQII